MRKILYILIFVFLFACEKVIDVDLNDANPAIVIEGNLTNLPGLTQVTISKTGNYFGETSIERISDASVIITDDVGGSFALSETKGGIYELDDIEAEIGRTYTLSVEVEGVKYEASSKITPPVYIDSLSYDYEKRFGIYTKGFYLNMHYTDPPGIKNYYRIQVLRNGKFTNYRENFNVFDDRLSDGDSREIRLAQPRYYEGDKAAVVFISLDKGAYDFLNTFTELVYVNPGSLAPANPISNFSNGALGYFAAWSFSYMDITIK